MTEHSRFHEVQKPARGICKLVFHLMIRMDEGMVDGWMKGNAGMKEKYKSIEVYSHSMMV